MPHSRAARKRRPVFFVGHRVAETQRAGFRFETDRLMLHSRMTEASSPPLPRRALIALVLSFGCGVVLLVSFVIWPIVSVTWSFDHIEQKARKRVTAAELQSWATNLIAQQPPGSIPVDSVETNLPNGLRGIYRRNPSIVIYEAQTNSGEVLPGWVSLVWGGGMIGHCGFEIGPTNFIGWRGKSKWDDGVYFWKSP